MSEDKSWGVVLGSCAGALLFFCFALFMIPATIMIKAFVLIKLWGWFVIPTFGLAALSYPVAIGIGCIASFLTRQYPAARQLKEDEASWNATLTVYISALIAPWVTLLIGYIAYRYM